MVPVEHIKRQYADAFRQHGRSQAAVLCPKGRQNLRYDSLLAHCEPVGRTILDFGCGLGHLCEYLDARAITCDYTGVDLVEEFVQSNRTHFPNRKFELIEGADDISGTYDIVLASGVFNIRYSDNPAQNKSFVFSTIQKLWKLTTHALTIDFLSSQVDYMQEDAFHVDPAEIIHFAFSHLGRRITVDHSYLPFEFCITAQRMDKIDRARGVYGE